MVVMAVMVVACDWRSVLSAAGGLFGAEECLWVWCVESCKGRRLCRAGAVLVCTACACYSRLYAR